MSCPGTAPIAPSEHEEPRRAVLAVLERAGIAVESGSISVRASDHASTAQTFLVTCAATNGRRLLLHCKQGNDANRSYGHRGGCEHEVCVYEGVLPATGLSIPRWYGSWRDPFSGRLWLVMEHLVNAVKLTAAGDGSLERAAEWISDFHHRTSRLRFSYLARYDRAYYQGWLTRAAQFVQGGAPAWLEELARNSGVVADILLGAPASIVHGEYYPANILVDDGAVYPIDWESAAIGPGEIDLAALTDDWDEQSIRAAERAYVTARWGGLPPSDFPRVLTAARLYWHSRWLGEQPRWTNHASTRWRWDALRLAAEELGALSPRGN